MTHGPRFGWMHPLYLAFRAALLIGLVACAPGAALCQPSVGVTTSPQPPKTGHPLTADTYVPIDATGRGDWVVDGTVGRRSLFVVGPLATI